jgi:hypothetical protein
MGFFLFLSLCFQVTFIVSKIWNLFMSPEGTKVILWHWSQLWELETIHVLPGIMPDSFVLSQMNILTCGVIGSYSVVLAIDSYMYTSLSYITLNVLRRALNMDFHRAFTNVPFQTNGKTFKSKNWSDCQLGSVESPMWTRTHESVNWDEKRKHAIQMLWQLCVNNL